MPQVNPTTGANTRAPTTPSLGGSSNSTAPGNVTLTNAKGVTSTVTGASVLPAATVWAPFPGDSEPIDNKPFDARARRMSRGFGSTQVATGSMSTAAIPPLGAAASSSTTPILTPVPALACYFRFNPAEIDTSYQFDPTALGNISPEGEDPGQAQLGNVGLLQNQTLSFNLFFDRTYELWAGPDSVAINGGPGRFGVLWDVWAIERLAGVYGQAISGGAYRSGPPAANIVNIQFGGGPGQPHGPAQSGANGAIQFTGWLSALSVQYTRFDAHMVPSRCAVAISFQLVYQNFNVTVAPANSENANTQTSTGTYDPTSLTTIAAPTTPAGG